MKLLNKAGEMPSLEPPEDESIKTLYVGGVDARITEQDVRDNFYAHGEIESIKLHPQKAFAFVTYTTREGAEKAAEELSNKLVIKGLRLKLLWGKPQIQRPEGESLDEARQQAAVAHSGMLPRSLISQQQNQYQHQHQQHPGAPELAAAPTPYFNIPPPHQDRAYYPSMDPQRMGALVPAHEGENKSGPEKQQQGQHYPFRPPMPPPHGQYHQHLYPPYGYMQPMAPYPPPYHSTIPRPNVQQSMKQYQHPAQLASAPPGPPTAASAPSTSAPPVSSSLGPPQQLI